jgi:hypothetical protein
MLYKLTDTTAADIDDAFPAYGECHGFTNGYAWIHRLMKRWV